MLDEELDLDLTPGTLDKTNDPVRLYLREMAIVPLLTRDGEVAIARRIERGRNRVLKSISRSPLCVEDLIQIGERLKRGELHMCPGGCQRDDAQGHRRARTARSGSLGRAWARGEAPTRVSFRP